MGVMVPKLVSLPATLYGSSATGKVTPAKERSHCFGAEFGGWNHL